MTIEDAVGVAATILMQMDGVEGVGQGMKADRPCIRVYVRSADAAAALPRSLNGFPVDPIVTGIILAEPGS